MNRRRFLSDIVSPVSACVTMSVLKGQWLGGLSGGPLWTLVETELFSWRLAGVIYEYSCDFEILFAKRPDRLKPDGRIVHSPE